METAVYGRMKFSKCIERDYGYVGSCEANVMPAADNMCSGRRSCEIPIPNSHFDLTKPCPNDLKSYLETSFSCLKAVSGDGAMCRPGEPLRLTAPSGNIANVLTEETKLGSADCPWMIQAKSGQKISITLMDFSTIPTNDDVCHAYAILRENHPQRSNTICSGKSRESQVYTSVSNVLEVRIIGGSTAQTKGTRYFILKYKAVGCPDLLAPKGGWVERTDEKIKVGCHGSDETFVLTCAGTTWEGKYNNCTGGADGTSGSSWGPSNIPISMSIILIMTIALILGIIILIFGLVVLRKKRLAYNKEQGYPSENTYQSATGTVKDRTTPPIYKHEEGYYHSTENEYAYISDLPPPPPPSTRDEGFYSSGYGPTASISSKNIHPPLMRGTSAHGHPCVKGYERGVPVHGHIYLDGEDPPKYFELDPQVEVHNGRKAGKSSAGSSRGMRIPMNSGSYKSSGACSGYDHLGGDGLTHNKSV